ncbi:hypothetical protein [Frankia sp. Cj3]|uniref:hypothetical protein n=1 Tax=Frankia sp. Cj3 TaxID=2880976 RepID=UPI001EF64268|nr:hypothetical protein [Frankia sp. Cj3]
MGVDRVRWQRSSSADWELDVGDLPELRVGYQDGLIIGLLPEPLGPDADGQQMMASDMVDAAPDVMVGAGIGVVQLSTVGLVMLHRRFTPLVQSRVAWAVGIRLRRQRLLAGADPRVVMTGARPTANLVPAGVSFSGYPVRLREDGAVSVVEVWEVLFPALIIAGEPSPA